MRTSSALSGIIWTSSKYCNDILRQLTENGTLSWWAFVRHKPETEDFEGNQGKEHIHAYVVPSAVVDSDILASCWDEIDKKGHHQGASKVWQKTKRFGDWYRYAIHDEDYLAERGLLRRYHYDYKDIETSDGQMLFEMVADIEQFNIKDVAMREASRGVPWPEFLFRWRRSIPLNLIFSVREIFRAVQEVGADFVNDSWSDGRVGSRGSGGRESSDEVVEEKSSKEDFAGARFAPRENSKKLKPKRRRIKNA